MQVLTPLPPLSVRQLHGSRWWLTLEDYTVRVEIGGRVYALTVLAGYRYDRSTVPWIVGWYKDRLGCVGCLVHDALYGTNGIPGYWWDCDNPYRQFTRAEADELFRRLMIADRVDLMSAWTAWQAVRVFGRRW